jgi:hypothetical protein
MTVLCDGADEAGVGANYNDSLIITYSCSDA